MIQWQAVDLFAGCGGLTLGLKRAGFRVIAAVENDDLAANTSARNHPEVELVKEDIREVWSGRLGKGQDVHLVAGCPPCQGFSRVRRKNRRRSASDDRNWLIDEFERIVKTLLPPAVFLENVPGIERYYRFRSFLSSLRKLGYLVTVRPMELSLSGVPQYRRRIVVLAGLGFSIDLPRLAKIAPTVRTAIGDLPEPAASHWANNQIMSRNR